MILRYEPTREPRIPLRWEHLSDSERQAMLACYTDFADWELQGGYFMRFPELALVEDQVTH